jgi:xanthine dehydrogenase accessory factor
MAQMLASLARTLGWHANLIAGPDFGPGDADEQSMVVVATQGHNDEEVLERAAAARPAYLGLVGSQKRGNAVLGYLADRGVPAEQLDRIRVPAGLDLGSTAHVEIAVAILAELVKLRSSGAISTSATPGTAAASGVAAPRLSTNRGTGGSDGSDGTVGSGGTGGTAPTVPAEEAIDPVCGMTVRTSHGGGLPLELDGSTYYFCCAGCRRAFENDPAAFVRASR